MAGTKRVRLTDAAITRLRPREREYTVWDTRIAGLGVRVRPSGGRSWIFLRKTGGGTRRISLGPVELKAVEEVCRQCHALAAAEPGSQDKPEDARNAVPSFRDFVAGAWREAHCGRYKPSTQRGVRSALANQLLPAFGSKPLGRIAPAQVRRWFDTYSRTAPGGANHTLDLLRQIMNFAVACAGQKSTAACWPSKTERQALISSRCQSGSYRAIR